MHSIHFTDDINASLAGTYIEFTSSITKKKLVVWYSVDNVGSAPNIPNAKFIEVSIKENDKAMYVVWLTNQKLKIEPFFEKTNVNKLTKLELTYAEFGTATQININNTPFNLTTINEGVSVLVGEILLDYSNSGNPIYNGNELKNLKFNPFTASFDLEFSDIQVTLDTTASSFEVFNIPVPLADTELTLTIPNGTKKYKLKSREPNTQLYISHNSNGDFFTVPYGATYSEDGINTNSLALYVKTSRDNRTLELLVWS